MDYALWPKLARPISGDSEATVRPLDSTEF